MRLLLIIFMVSTQISVAQQPIQGQVFDQDNQSLVGANIYIKGTYEGTISDKEGSFTFSSLCQYPATLVISFLGFETCEIELTETTSLPLRIKLHETSDPINEVTISASSFEAGEKKRAILLTPVEIATTASSNGDIFGALTSFPGVQENGETGQLIVRGGDISESKTYMDGLLIATPYTSSMPDLPSRGRFSPFMFNGIMFSTGGYSAEYGQALSSVLELTTPGSFDEDITSISLLNVGIGIEHTQRYARSSYSCGIDYNHTGPYMKMSQNQLNWLNMPQSTQAKLYHRLHLRKSGILKTDIFYNRSTSALDYSSINASFDQIRLDNKNLLLKSHYSDQLNPKWLLKAGVAFNNDDDRKSLDNDKLAGKLVNIHAKAGLIHFSSDHLTLKMGTDMILTSYRFSYFRHSDNQRYPLRFSDIIQSFYLESDLKLNAHMALRTGGRMEISSLTNQTSLSPRLSLAYKTSSHSQVSLATGKYFQQPGLEYLKYPFDAKAEEATHYILNYQWQTKERVFRAELYRKDYRRLLTYKTGSDREYTSLGNLGYGYAQGLDLFWYDEQTIGHLKYWLAYSFTDSRRKYHDYIQSVTPEYLARHHASVVAKYWWNPVSTQIGVSYNYSSGRPYHNPNSMDFMSGTTPPVHDVSLNLSYITNLMGNFTIVHLAIGNLLGRDKIHSYQFPDQPDSNGYYSPTPIKSMMQQTIILGVFISIK